MFFVENEYFQCFPAIITVMDEPSSKIRIGIPGTLFASYHFAYWQRLITLSGMEAVFSDASDRQTADRGGRRLPHEFCIPVKVFIGHVLNLLEKGADQILLPRMTAQGKANFFCPKLIGLPEIVRYTTGLGAERTFAPEIVCNGLDLRVTKFPELGRAMVRRMKAATGQADKAWQSILAQCRSERITLWEATVGEKMGRPAGGLNIGLLGYAYSLYDPFISKGILEKLHQLGAAVTTWEMLDPLLIEQNLAGLKRPLFWNFGKMLLGAGLSFINDSKIDGLIYVTTFGCGPDSVAMKILSIEASQKEKPLLLINLDDHQEDGHLRTRLEAFTDMLAAIKEERAI
ncbi:MAG: acyl-CoA dehydratase activase-related protein [Bacteroidota bacterium]